MKKKKIALIHGWNWKNYSSLCSERKKNAWENRNKLVEELEKDFEVFKFNLPGFCGEPEPVNKVWNLEDFARHLENLLAKNNFIPDIILGYSFGGAVALKWKTLFKKQTKIVLISPAISRKYEIKQSQSKLRQFAKSLLPNFLTKALRNFYLVHILKNPYYSYGTKFLKKTYLNIVLIDLSQELQQIPPDEIQLIFGAKDTATPPKLLLDKISSIKLKNRFAVMENGDHNIGQTHFREIRETVKKFVGQTH